MNINLSIDTTTCIKCAKCVKVCPSKIFVQNSAGEDITLERVETCIVCGHCVAVCPTDSVSHSAFPADKVHTADYSAYPTPEQMMMLIKSRRSNRAFSKKAVPSEALEQILEAAHRAPTGSNMQQVEFTLVTDPEKLHLISKFTIDTFSAILKKIDTPLMRPIVKKIMPDIYRYIPAFKRLKDEFEKGNDMILRGATAAILIHTPKNSRLGKEDTNLAYQNGSLMAECLGISQFYMGFVLSATKQKKDELEKALGINGRIHSAIALGVPLFRYPKYIDKKDIVVKKL